MPAAIETDGLSKRYRLGVDAPAYDTLRERIARGFRRERPSFDGVWALRDLSITVSEGESLGVIGSNGAGKTTLLKLLAGITEPTSGYGRVRGRVGALLDVGTGFHPELTGRENIYLNGAILGLARAEVQARFEEIVEFSGLESFLETPVKRYSDGMQLRLAFAVAAHIEPPIMVVDEVLAVGDAKFRERCLGRMAELGGRGRTVVFVSHDLGAITKLCSRVIWLERGQMRDDGPPEAVTGAYLAAAEGEAGLAALRDSSATIATTGARLRDGTGSPSARVARGESFFVDLEVRVGESVRGLDLAVWLLDRAGNHVIDEAVSDHGEDLFEAGQPGSYGLTIEIPGVLPAGQYVVGVWIGTEHEDFQHEELFGFRIDPRALDRRASLERRRIVQPPVRWSLRFPGGEKSSLP